MHSGLRLLSVVVDLSQHCENLRRGNPLSHKLQVGEWRSLASYDSLIAGRSKNVGRSVCICCRRVLSIICTSML